MDYLYFVIPVVLIWFISLGWLVIDISRLKAMNSKVTKNGNYFRKELERQHILHIYSENRHEELSGNLLDLIIENRTLLKILGQIHENWEMIGEGTASTVLPKDDGKKAFEALSLAIDLYKKKMDQVKKV